jgi:twinkle protein
MIQDHKKRLGERAKDIIAYGIGLNKYKQSKGEACCPFHNEKTASFKWHDKGFFWKCFGCGEVLDIYRYYTDFRGMEFSEALKEVANMTGGEIKVSYQKPNIVYKKPCIKTDKLSREAIDYMSKRLISEQTLTDWKVVQREWNGKQCYVFQYFDENNELQFVSYREIIKGGLKGGCEKDTMPILWGMWHIDKKCPVVIVEGQPDAMAVWESGYKNVVSVPSGSNNLTWIDNCWEWLQDINEFIIFGDNDEAGTKMVTEIMVRLGKNKVKVVNHQYKDANELLFRSGKSKVLEVINEAIRQTPKGIIKMSDYPYMSFKDRKNEGIPTGIYGLDSEIDDLQPEYLTILFGRNSEGKSTLISQILCHSIDNKVPVFLYSGELSTNRLLDWLYRQVIGVEKNYLDFVQTKYKVKAHIKDSALKALRKWSGDYFYSFDRSATNVRKDIDTLFEVMDIAVKRYGCKLLVIDNLMSAMTENADSVNADQGNFVQRCKDFAEAYRVHIILVAHPNKLKGKGQALEKEDISGSLNIGNKADIILAMERNYKDDRDCDNILRLLKDREEGICKSINFMFVPESKRLLEIGRKELSYNWKQYLVEQDTWEEAKEVDICPF